MKRGHATCAAVATLVGALAASLWLGPDAAAEVRTLTIDGQRPRAAVSAGPLDWGHRGHWDRHDRHRRWGGRDHWGYRHGGDWHWRHGHPPWPPYWHRPGPWPGYWKPAPVWVPGHWVWTGWGWHWVPGHWR